MRKPEERGVRWTETPLRVRYAETDQMGVAYYANYLTWFEVGRTEWIRAVVPYREIEARGLLLPVLEARCRYLAPARYDDALVVRTALTRWGPVRLAFAYEIRRADNAQPIAEGETEHVWVDRSFHPVNLKKHSPDLYRLLSAAVSDGAEPE